jgi:hypothetical protein
MRGATNTMPGKKNKTRKNINTFSQAPLQFQRLSTYTKDKNGSTSR